MFQSGSLCLCDHADREGGWPADWVMCSLSWRETSIRTCSPETSWTTCSIIKSKSQRNTRQLSEGAVCTHLQRVIDEWKMELLGSVAFMCGPVCVSGAILVPFAGWRTLLRRLLLIWMLQPASLAKKTKVLVRWSRKPGPASRRWWLMFHQLLSGNFIYKRKQV